MKQSVDFWPTVSARSTIRRLLLRQTLNGHNPRSLSEEPHPTDTFAAGRGKWRHFHGTTGGLVPMTAWLGHTGTCLYTEHPDNNRDFSIFFFNFFNVYLFAEGETEHERGTGRERGKPRIQSRLQALSHQHRARRGAQTHKPGDRDLSRSRTLHRRSHPGAPFFF